MTNCVYVLIITISDEQFCYMPIEVLMPALSPTMTKGKLVKWCKNLGDKIEIGDVIAEVETDKATMEVEAFEDGKIGEILVQAGTADVAVNSVIALILSEGETEKDLKNYSSKSQLINELSSDKKQAKEENSLKAPTVEKDNLSEEISISNDQRVKASPLAKSIAKNEGVSLSEIQVGSGPYGRIIKEDVLNFINKPGIKTSAKIQDQYSEISTMRNVIAKRLVESKQTIPHFYLTVDCNLNKITSIRKQINTDAKITINDFIIKATACALHDFPDVNSSWLGDKIQHYGGIDVAVAVSLDEGLITPIISNADSKPIKLVSTEMKSLAKRAKEGKLSSHEYQGGSITISNLGMFGIREFIAIINPPQSSILAVGVAEPRAIVNDGELEVANMMTMTLSVDHRVVDGSLGAQFLNKIKYYVEHPLDLLIS